MGTLAPVSGLDSTLVVVTGGANGIGRSVTHAFASSGANVLCVDYDSDGGAETVAEAASLKGNVKYFHADMSDSTVPETVVATARDWQDGQAVSTLVNNVGIQEDNGTPAHLLEESVWDKVMNVNLKSYFLMSKFALPGMLKEKTGVIINMASVQGKVNFFRRLNCYGCRLSQVAIFIAIADLRRSSVTSGNTGLCKLQRGYPFAHPPNCNGLLILRNSL